MLRFLYADQLADHPKLAQAMFQDRAYQFKERLNWDVTVDDAGLERDEYDALNPLYIIWEAVEGGHGGSLRLLPTTGPVMVNDHFSHLTTGPIVSPHIWECTRFCLSKDANPRVAAALMLGGGAVMQNFEVDHFVGVFDTRMVRIYQRTGSAPTVIGSAGEGRSKIQVGLWSFDKQDQRKLATRSDLPLSMVNHWFHQSFFSTEANTLKKAG